MTAADGGGQARADLAAALHGGMVTYVMPGDLDGLGPTPGVPVAAPGPDGGEA